MKPTLTIGILTHNSELFLYRCLASCQFADQIIIVDSGSVDSTPEIAMLFDAQFYSYPEWQGFGVQRNRLLQHVKTDYILFIDSDEEITPPLQAEIESAIATNTNAIYKICWQNVVLGKHIKGMETHASGRFALFKTNYLVKFSGLVHEYPVIKQRVPEYTFKNTMIHYSRPTLYGSFIKHLHYAHTGAVQLKREGKSGSIITGLFEGAFMFGRYYFKEKGIYCGARGFILSALIGFEFFMRQLILKYDAPTIPLKRP
jgi:glycosyltransferase involved in cell wall biosynthesis